MSGFHHIENIIYEYVMCNAKHLSFHSPYNYVVMNGSMQQWLNFQKCLINNNSKVKGTLVKDVNAL